MTYVTYDYYLPHTVGALFGILIVISYYFPHFIAIKCYKSRIAMNHIAIKCYKSRIAMNQSPKLLGLQVQPYSARRLGPPLRPQAMELRRNSRARSAMVHCFVKEQRRPPFQRRKALGMLGIVRHLPKQSLKDDKILRS